MADKKFGIKLVCKNCEGKFYSLGKTDSLSCPVCKSEYNLDDDINYIQPAPNVKEIKNENKKNEFEDIDTADSSSEDNEDGVLSLDDPNIDEQVSETN